MPEVDTTIMSEPDRQIHFACKGFADLLEPHLVGISLYAVRVHQVPGVDYYRLFFPSHTNYMHDVTNIVKSAILWQQSKTERKYKAIFNVAAQGGLMSVINRFEQAMRSRIPEIHISCSILE